MSTTYQATQVTGYGETTEDGPGEATTVTHVVTYDELVDLLGSEDRADALIADGRLGEHDEWTLDPLAEVTRTAEAVRTATADRDRAIRRALAYHSTRTVGEAAGLSHTGVAKIGGRG